MVYNNADDTKLNFARYFPACSRGKILITTRNRRITMLGQGIEPHCHVSEMSTEDSLRLLAKAAGASGDIGEAGKLLAKVICRCLIFVS
jgi:hypothetical protein